MKEFARDHAELVEDDVSPDDAAKDGEHVGAELKNEAEVPDNQERENDGDAARGRWEVTPGAGKFGASGSESEDEYGSKRNEETDAEGFDAVPPGICRDKKVEGSGGYQDLSAKGRKATPEKKQADNGGNQDRGPKESAAIGGKEDVQEVRGEPVPVAGPVQAESERAAEDNFAHDELWREGDGRADGENTME